MTTERRIVRGDSLDDTVVVWEKFECDNGCRWTQTKGQDPRYWHVAKDGDPCNFSGCKSDGHRIHKRGETSDRKEAHDWFRDVHRGVNVPSVQLPATLTSANMGDAISREAELRRAYIGGHGRKA